MKYSKSTYPRSILQQVLAIALMAQPSVLALSTLLLPLIAAPPAQAVPLPKDWCGRLWGIQTSTGVINWDDPTTGVSSLANANPPPNVANIPALNPVTDYASLGIHARSGTLYTLNRNTSILYYYSMATGGIWRSYNLSAQIPKVSFFTVNGVRGTREQEATVNFNKMTVTGDELIIASSTSAQTFTYQIIPATGALSSTSGTAATFTYASSTTYGSTPGGNPIIGTTAATGESTRAIGGGDIAQDEYSDTYNLTYDNLSNGTTQNPVTVPPASTGTGTALVTNTQYLYFYKKVGSTWQYRGRVAKVDPADSFAGFAVYNDALYVKGTVGQLFKVTFGPTARSNGEYDWGNLNITTVGGIEKAVSDLATCGVPAINVTKTQSVYSDAAGTVLTPIQNRIGTGQYIRYTIVVTNKGDAWARGTFLQDPLPTGVTYVPNTATENGTNLNAATYPFASKLISTTTSESPGVVPLPFNNQVNVATYTFLARVIGNVSVANQATVSYTNPYPSDPSNCTTGLNCGVSPLETLFPSIFGTVWNDKNGSAGGTFSNIFTTGELGTNTGSPTALYALLLDSTGNVSLSTPVASDGTYAFQALTGQNGFKVQLSTTPGTVGNLPPAASIPAGWKATSPKAQTTPFNLTTADVTDQDFGISLPAGTVLVKRITGIIPAGSTNTTPLTVNPYDNTVLFNTVVSDGATDPVNDPNWLTGYTVGATNGGKTRSGDQLEYTVYYLNTKGADTKNLKICDPIRGKQTYVPGSMTQKLGDGAILTLTDAVDPAVDLANSYTTGNAPGNCNAANTSIVGADKGGVVTSVASPIPSATAPGSPANSYGWFRFRTVVDK